MAVQLASCRRGRFLVLDNDVYIGRLLLRDGLYSDEEVQLFAQLLRPGDVAIEAGANIGAHTVPMAKMVGSEGRILAFEPQKHIYNMLCANLALNDLHNVDTYRFGLGSTGTDMYIPGVDYDGLNNFGGLRLNPICNGREKVRIVPIDALEDIRDLRLLKADVEGMEIDVLIGAQQTISRCRPFLYIEDDENDREPRRKVMRDMGYKTFDHHIPLLGPDDPFNPFPGYTIASKNILGVPEEASYEFED